jgi:hypothetical protein
MLPISGGLVRWQPTCNLKTNALYRLYDTNIFTICNHLLQHFGTFGFIHENSVLFVKIWFYSCLFAVYS